MNQIGSAGVSGKALDKEIIGSFATPGKNGGRYKGLQQDCSLACEAPSIQSETQAVALIKATMKDAQAATKNADAGSTGSIGIIKNGILTVGQVGDSPIIVYVKDRKTGRITAHDLTHDHSPENPAEAARIEHEGGFVANGRVNGVLAVARSFGDKSVGKGVSSEADIYSVDLRKYVKNAGDQVWVAVASDGLTENAKPAHFNQIISSGAPPATLAKRMAEEAMVTGSTDNISVNVAKVSFHLKDAPAQVLAIMDGHDKGGEHISAAVRQCLRQQLEQHALGAAAKNTVGQKDVSVTGYEWLGMKSPRYGEVARVDAENMKKEERQTLVAALADRGVKGMVIHSQTFDRDYVQIDKADVAKLFNPVADYAWKKEGSAYQLPVNGIDRLQLHNLKKFFEERGARVAQKTAQNIKYVAVGANDFARAQGLRPRREQTQVISLNS